MDTSDLYEKLRIPKNLQEHMLRVAALVQLLTENWMGEKIYGDSIRKACLFHDTANILKFDFSVPEMLGDESKRVDYWQQVQREVRGKYGENLHMATLKICREAGLDQETLRIIDGMEWNRVGDVINESDWPVALGIYADMRIGPFGILTLKERLGNLNRRRPMRDYEKVRSNALKLEEVIQKKIDINLQTISDQLLESMFSELMNLSVVA